MTKREENKYSMFRSVHEVLKENETLLKTIPALENAFTAFDKSFAEISQVDAKQKTVSKGTVLDKQNTQDDLIDVLLKIGGVLYVAGKNKKDENLKSISAVSYSHLKRMRFNDLLIKAKTIHQSAIANLETLKSLHLEIDAEMKEFDAKLLAYENAVNTKEIKSAESQASRKALDTAFDNADEILNDELDNLMEIIRSKDIDLYNKYYSARVIKDLGMRKTKKEEEEAEPITASTAN